MNRRRRAAAARIVTLAPACLLSVIAIIVSLQHFIARSESPSPPLTTLRINVNVADEQKLRLLPGIGPALAARIVADRESNGPFKNVDDLKRVRGIGDRERVHQGARQVGRRTFVGQTEVDPAALAVAVEQARFGQQLQVPGDAWLRLSEDVAEVGDFGEVEGGFVGVAHADGDLEVAGVAGGGVGAGGVVAELHPDELAVVAVEHEAAGDGDAESAPDREAD